MKRRIVLGGSAAVLMTGGIGWPGLDGGFAPPGLVRAAHAADQAAQRAERSVGKPEAKVTVTEFFSLTCGHCAAFARTVLPDVKQKLIDTGKLRLVYWDYPLDQLALMAAMVARHLPPERYEPFVLALLSTQDRWAFNRGANPTEELWKMAALAGMSKQGFDAAIADNALRDWILTQARSAQEKWRVDATPSFVVNGQKLPSGPTLETFQKLVSD